MRLLFILVVMVLVFGCIGSKPEEATTLKEEIEETTTIREAIAGETILQEVQETKITKTEAWTAYQNFLDALKNGDIDKVNSLMYTPLDMSICPSSFSEEKCLGMVSVIYTLATKGFKKEDFVNVEQDDKQIIISTNPVSKVLGNERTYSKSSIFFVRDPDGSTKVLITKMSVHSSSGTSSEKDIGEIWKDSDGDGLIDGENCAVFDKDTNTCIKTNPNLKDSDSDGWWDSVEVEAGTDPTDVNDQLY